MRVLVKIILPKHIQQKQVSLKFSVSGKNNNKFTTSYLFSTERAWGNIHAAKTPSCWGQSDSHTSAGLPVWVCVTSQGEKDLPWNRNKTRDCASAYGFSDHQGRDPQRCMELCQGQDTPFKLGLNPGITLALCSQIEVCIYIYIYKISIYIRHYNMASGRPIYGLHRTFGQIGLANIKMPRPSRRHNPAS